MVSASPAIWLLWLTQNSWNLRHAFPTGPPPGAEQTMGMPATKRWSVDEVRARLRTDIVPIHRKGIAE